MYKNKSLYGISNKLIGDLCNKAFGVNYDESAHRKKIISYLDGYNDAKIENKTSSENLNEMLDEIKTEQRKLAIEKVKLRDERNEYSRLLRNEARLEQKIELIEQSFIKEGQEQYTLSPKPVESSDNDLIVSLSDLHIGSEFYNLFGVYNVEIAKERLEKYLSEIKKIKQCHKSENCYVVLLGDLISGNIHYTIQISNRENIINQMKICAKLVANFLYELSQIFNKVFVVDVVGNHSRLTNKDDSVKDERLDLLIPWYCEAKLSSQNNIIFLEDSKYDVTWSVFKARGRIIWAAHGDYDSFSKTGIANLVLMVGYKPSAMLFGHYHTSDMLDISDIKLIRSGCLCGSGDDYTIQKRISGSPSQMVTVIGDNGVISLYPVNLN